MRHLVPPFVLGKLSTGERQGSFPAVGIFVDVSGFSTITDALLQHGQHGAEVLAEAMRAILDPLVHAVYAQGGFVAFFAGDALTALFAEQPGRPPSLLRALAAVGAMQPQMEVHYPTPYGDFSFSIKVGLAAGTVDWGILATPDERRHAYYFAGSAVDDCAQAEHSAERGQVILSPVARQALGATIAVEPAGLDAFRLLTAPSDLPASGEITLPPDDPSGAAAFFPAGIVGQELSGEFRQVVNLFLGLPGRPTHDQLAAIMGHVFDLQERYGGLLNHIDFGDKGCTLLFFWGAPTALENDVERALNFVLDLQAAVPMLRAGLSYRIAHAGFVGSSLQEEYACYGRGVNLAARLMAAAPEGAIWLDEPLAQRAGQGFARQSLGERTFKGFARPQPVFLLQGRRSLAGPLFAGELVGRQEELARLESFCRPLGQGRSAGVLVVRGEAGMGKSRLLHEFRRRYSAARWFLAPADEILRGSLNPFRYWLRSYFEQQRDSESERRARFEQKLADLIARTPEPSLQAELERTRSFLGALVDLSWPGSLYEQLEPQLRFQNILAALAALLQAESRSGPVVLQLEDVQWLDGDSRQFLRYLTRLLALAEGEGRMPYPVALLAAARPPEPGSPLLELAAPGTPQEVLDLGALAEEEVGRLAEGVLGQALSLPMRSELASRADGNPFFVEQLALYLRERGLLAEGPEGLGLAAAAEVLLPVDVRAVLVARLDRLAAEVKRVVQTAAVLGREFEVKVLSAMLREEEVPERVREAEEEAIWTALSEMRYLFRHALLRDSAYEMQLQARRRELHALAGESLEKVYAGELAPHYADLAYHFDRAEVPDRAAHWYRLAGEQSARGYANAEAVAYLSRALELLPEADLVGRYELTRARVEVYDLQGAVEAQSQDLEQMAALAAALDDGRRRAHVAVQQAQYHYATDDYSAAIAAARQAAALSQAAGAVESEAAGYAVWGRALYRQSDFRGANEQMLRVLELARSNGLQSQEGICLQLLGMIAYERGEYAQGQSYYQEALVIFEQLGLRRRQGNVFNNLGLIYMDQNEYHQAIACFEQSLRIYQEIGDRRNAATGLINPGVIAYDRGEYSRARSYYEQALRLLRELGNRIGEVFALNNLALVEHSLGRYKEAEKLYKQSLDIYVDLGNRQGECIAYHYLGLAFHQQGQNEQAQELCRKALAIAEELGARQEIGFALTHLGHALAELRQLDEAANSYRRAYELRREAKQPNLATEPLAGLARLALAQGDLAAAFEYVQEILDYLQSGNLDGTQEPIRVYLTCYQVLQVQGDRRADEVLEQAYRLVQERAAGITDAEMRRSFLENVTANRKLVELKVAQ